MDKPICSVKGVLRTGSMRDLATKGGVYCKSKNPCERKTPTVFEELGDDFQKVLDDNLWELYEEDLPAPTARTAR